MENFDTQKYVDEATEKLVEVANQMIADNMLCELNTVLRGVVDVAKSIDNKAGLIYSKQYVSQHYPELYKSLLSAVGNYVRIYTGDTYQRDSSAARHSKSNRMYVQHVTIHAGTPMGTYIILHGLRDDGENDFGLRLHKFYLQGTSIVRSRCPKDKLAEMRRKMPPADDFHFVNCMGL